MNEIQELEAKGPAPYKCAVVGIVGRTNSGKSSLINQMVGEKISIVSPVQQTTRNTIRWILTEDRGQLVFRDTPGLHKAESVLGTLMNRMARAAAFDLVQPQVEWMSLPARTIRTRSHPPL